MEFVWLRTEPCTPRFSYIASAPTIRSAWATFDRIEEPTDFGPRSADEAGAAGCRTVDGDGDDQDRAGGDGLPERGDSKEIERI